MSSALDSYGACQDSASVMAPASTDVYQLDDESNGRCILPGSAQCGLLHCLHEQVEPSRANYSIHFIFEQVKWLPQSS